MRSNSELARHGGIRVGEKGGVSVDPYMETNLKDIYACGDCVECKDVLTGEKTLNLFWRNANKQGWAVANNVTGIRTAYPGSDRVVNIDIFGNHVTGFGYTEGSLDNLKVSKTLGPDFEGVSIIENERNGAYYRLVILGDRCIGAQFINVKKDLGLIWSIMIQKRSVKELVEALENKTRVFRRPWLRRFKPFIAINN
jgi:NADH oxidase (H2O2-forming)